LREQQCGPDHPDLAIELGNLGLALEALGDLPAARAALERALAISIASAGGEHPSVGVALANLAVVLRRQGEFAAARSALERANHLFAQYLAPTDPARQATLAALRSLA
jgi:tetratricopeptide (TPR) repeat protein